MNPGNNVPDEDGLTSIRVFEPCTAPDGRNCTIFDDPTLLHLAESRWYPTAIRVFDGSLVSASQIRHVTCLFRDTAPLLRLS